MNTSSNSSSISAHPAPAQPSYRKAVQEFHRNICERATSLAEVKAAIYVFDNTVGFMEFDQPKRISLDEFQHGRKKKDGSRLDSGCGMVKRASIVDGIRLAEKHGLFYTIVDASDRARIEKLYAPRLTLPSKDASQRSVSVTSDSAISEDSQLARGYQEPSPRSVSVTSEVGIGNLDHSKYLKKETLESTFSAPSHDTAEPASLAADAALEEKGFSAEEDELRRQISILKEEEEALKARVLRTWEQTKRMMQVGTLRMSLESKLERLLSGSQAQQSASQNMLPASPQANENEQESEALEELAPRRSLDEERSLLDDYNREYSHIYTARHSAGYGTPEYRRLSEQLRDLQIEMNACRARISALEPPVDASSTELFPDAPAVEITPRNNFQAAALALGIELRKDMPHNQHSLLTAIAKRLQQLGAQPAQAVEALRRLKRENPWVNEVGGYTKLLPQYVAAV